MISKLTASAGSNLGSLGSGLFNTGVSADAEAFGEADILHNQNQARWANIFSSIGSTLGTVGQFVPGIAGKILTGAGGVMQSTSSNSEDDN